MQKLVWQNANGDTIDLTSEPFGITHWEGFSNASLNIQTQQVPFQDGCVFLDALINQRELSVTLAIYDGNDLSKRYQYRRELIHALNPKIGEGYLIYTNDYISKRIKCVAQVPLFETHNSDTRGTPKASLAWTTCEPYWEDLEEISIDFDTIDTVNVNNDGDVKVSPIININATNAKNIKIKNFTNGKSIGYDGLLTGRLLINTQAGEKKVNKGIDVFDIKNTNSPFRWCIYFKEKVLFASVDYILITNSDLQELTFIPLISANGNEYDMVANDKYVAILYFSTIQFSSNLESWKYTYISIEGKWIFYQNNYFLIISAYGGILKSFDLENWEQIREEDYGTTLDKSFQANGRIFLREMFTGNLLTVNDTTLSTVFSDDVAIGLIYINSNYYILGATRKIYKSSDLSNWTEISTNLPQENFNNFFYNPIYTCYIAVSDNGIYKSLDLNEWEKIYELSNEIAYSALFLPEIGQTIILTDIIRYSRDLVTWAEIKGEPLGSMYEAFGNTYYCCADYLLKVKNGISEKLLEEQGAGYKEILPWKNGKYLLFSNHKIYESSNGDDWTLLYTYSDYIDKICVNNNALIMTDSDNRSVFISSNATSWQSISVFEGSIIPLDVATNGDYFLLTTRVGTQNGDIYKITNNGVATIVYSDFVNGVEDIVYNPQNSTFVCSYGGEYESIAGIYISSNGSSWEKVNNTRAQSLKVFNSTIWGITDNNGLCYLTNNYFWVYESKPFYSSNYYYYIKSNGEIYFNYNGTILLKSKSFAENVISHISPDTDMSFCLNVGNNNILITSDEGYVIGTMTYRQKYLGV